MSWRALFGQFGASYKRIDHWKERFVDSLKIATAVYPHASIEVAPEGLVLRQSRPPVAPRLVSGGSPARAQG